MLKAMRRGAAVLVLLSSSIAGGCAEQPRKEVARVTPAPIEAVALTQDPHAKSPPKKAPEDFPSSPRGAVYEILSSEGVDELTSDAEAATPGWKITLDCFGFLSSAICAGCKSLRDRKLRAQDRERIAVFWRKQESLIGRPMPLLDPDERSVFQETPFGSTGGVVTIGPGSSQLLAGTTDGDLIVTGHAWPRLPDFASAVNDDVLKGGLRQMNPNPNLEFERRIEAVARAPDGPVELHAEGCVVDGGTFARTCIDAITLEDVTIANTYLRANGRNAPAASCRQQARSR